MQWLNAHLLSVLLFLPSVLAVFILLVCNVKFAKWAALVATLATFGVSLMLLGDFQSATSDFQFVEKMSWIPNLGITYELGVDGLSIWLVVLTTFLMPILVLGSFEAVGQKQKAYYALLLVLETGMLGAFFALDLFLFYVFWEAMLIPMYFLIGIWGGKDRIYAATKFFLYTMFGSLLMLVAIFYLAFQHQQQFETLNMSLSALSHVKLSSAGLWSEQSILFLAFALAFAIKVPLFPLHTWLPDAHVQAPTAGSVVLAGVLLKMGGYGFLRFAFPLFPEAVRLYQPMFLILGTVAIVYGAWVATVQPDIKKLVAYSSVSHMGYVILGLFSLNTIGVTGAVYQMLNHGIATPALFLLVGMIYERRHTREIKAFGGLAKVMPWFAIMMVISTLSAVALPGTNGFVGEFLILLGAWKASPILAAVSATGVIFGAVYMLWMVQRLLFGPITHEENKGLRDLTAREVIVMIPLVICIFGMGLFPKPFFQKMDSSIKKTLLVFQNKETQVAKRSF